MIPPRPRPLCAFCVDTPATTTCEWTDLARGTSRTVHACAECALDAIPDDLPRKGPQTATPGRLDAIKRGGFVELLKRLGPSTVPGLAAASGHKVYTVRNQLAALTSSGVVTVRSGETNGGNGRPLLVYALAESRAS